MSAATQTEILTAAIEYNFDQPPDLEELKALEWLETNGLGGWASSTLCGANTRRYHGLLVVSLHPPVDRYVYLSRLDETVACENKSYELSTRMYSGGVNPTGFRFLRRFCKKLFPTFEFEIPTEQGAIHLKKTIVTPHGENTVLIRYTLLSAPAHISLRLEPFVAARNCHTLSHSNGVINTNTDFSNSTLRLQPYNGLPALKIFADKASFHPEPDWYFNFEYEVERYRGLDDQEDLFRYGFLERTLSVGESITIAATTEQAGVKNTEKAFQNEQNRREALLKGLPHRDNVIDLLALAADQFIVRRGEQASTIIAGYHWFTDWGRDTMIALPGLCLATGRFEEAKKILTTFAQYVSEGMLPNTFPDADVEPEYNTVDATLWFFVAVHYYFAATNDEDFIRELYDKLLEIIDWHFRGTRFGIRVDSDGLLRSGEGNSQLTWMDARVGDWVVTPRHGKPVEVNSLWYNALMITHHLGTMLRREERTAELMERAESLKTSFQTTFWNEELHCLYDCVDDEFKDASIRPNQIFALSLPYPLLAGDKALSVLQTVKERLLTPVGLRSLDPAHRDYIERYGGDQLKRDGAYHQGTVWSWLIGPYLTALTRLRGDKGKAEAKEIVSEFMSHMYSVGVGTVSEIFDGATPNSARGCIAQAWGVGELLRAYVSDVC